MRIFNAKRLAAAAALVLAFCLLCGCSQDSPSGSAAATPAPAESAPAEPSVGLPNPISEVSREEMLARTGLSLSAPADAGGVKYFVIDDGDNDPIAQVEFLYNNKPFCYRAQPTGRLEAYDLTGLYYTWTEEKEVEVSYCPAHLMLCDEAGGLYWLDFVPGVNYALGCTAATLEDEMLDVALQVFEPLQDEVGGDDDIDLAQRDYTGRYTDDNGNSIKFAKAADGSYTVDLSILDQVTVQGTGSDMDGAVEISFPIPEDIVPDGVEVTAIFFPEENGTCTLKFTSPELDLIPVQINMTITGFVPAA